MLFDIVSELATTMRILASWSCLAYRSGTSLMLLASSIAEPIINYVSYKTLYIDCPQ